MARDAPMRSAAASRKAIRRDEQVGFAHRVGHPTNPAQSLSRIREVCLARSRNPSCAATSGCAAHGCQQHYLLLPFGERAKHAPGLVELALRLACSSADGSGLRAYAVQVGDRPERRS